MLFSHFPHHSELDRSSAALIMTFNRLGKCDNSIKAKHIDVARQEHVSQVSPVTLVV